jgi:aryl-alcohol dehydrogenase-like predicted oxidoreductase
MEYRLLGKTGVKVSELCLGTMTFGWTTTEEDSRSIMDRFVDAGGTFIDTADVYSNGASEQILGGWLAGRQRDQLFIATKVRFASGKGPNDLGLSRAHILAGVEASLRRLRTDYIDLYQVHCWDPLTPLEQTIEALDSLVRQGKVRYLGVSNFMGWQLQKAVETARSGGWEQPVCLQPLYNLLDRGAELELIPVCRNEGLGVICWSPLRGGWLSGRYRRDMKSPPAGTRVEMAEKRGWGETFTDYNTEHTWKLLEQVSEIARETGKPAAQVALRWLLQRPGVTAPIIAARTMDHLEDNLGASGWSLSAEQMARLTKASDKPLPYPYDLQPIQTQDRAG